MIFKGSRLRKSTKNRSKINAKNKLKNEREKMRKKRGKREEKEREERGKREKLVSSSEYLTPTHRIASEGCTRQKTCFCTR